MQRRRHCSGEYLKLIPPAGRRNAAWGALYQVEGKAEQAVAAHEAIVKMRLMIAPPTWPSPPYMKQTGKYQDSVAAVERIPTTSRPAEVLPLLAHDYFELAQPDKVPPLILQVLRLPPAEKDRESALDFVAVLLQQWICTRRIEVDATIRQAKPERRLCAYVGTGAGS